LSKIKRLRNRSLSIGLIFLLILSSTGIVLNKHFCQDELRSVHLFAQAKSCQQQAPERPACPLHPPADQQDEHQDCCDNKSEYHKTDTEQQQSESKPESTYFPAPISGPIIGILFPDAARFLRQRIAYLHFKPPLLTLDLTIRLQVFRC
jgi:hypothetical protein